MCVCLYLCVRERERMTAIGFECLSPIPVVVLICLCVCVLQTVEEEYHKLQEVLSKYSLEGSNFH